MTMKNFKLLLLLISVTLWLPIQAQQKVVLTAQQAIEMAIKNSVEVKNSELDKKTQDITNREIIGSATPQINGTVSMNRFFNIPVTLLPDFISPSVYNVLVDKGVRDGSGNPITRPTGEPQFFPAQFGVPWTASIGFTVQQLLFQPDVFVGIKARNAAMQYANDKINLNKDQLKENIYKSYNTLLVGAKRLELVNNSISRLTKLEHDTKELYKNGFVEKLDVDKITVALNNLKSTQVTVVNSIDIGYAIFKQALGIPQLDTLVLADQLNEASVKENILSQVEGFKYEDRSEIKLLNTVQTLQKLDLERYKLSYIPTIAAFWNYSENAQRQNFNFFKRGNAYPWFKTSIVGINMNVPIWDGMQRQRRIEKAKINLEKTIISTNGVKAVIDMEQAVVKKNLASALVTLDAQQRNMELAENVYHTTKKKFEQGLGSSFEVITSQNELETTRDKYMEALLNAMNAKTALLKSIGKL